MASGLVSVLAVAADAEVEIPAMLNQCLIKGRKQDVPSVFEIPDGEYEQTVIFPRIAAYDSSVEVSAGLGGGESFPDQGLFQVHQL